MIDLKRLCVLAGVLLMLSPVSGMAQEEDMNSANYMLPRCRAWLNKDQTVMSGVCAGSVATTMNLSGILKDPFRFCPPPSATRNQGVSIVVKYLEAHPEQWHEPFTALSVAAMILAWPCK